MPVVLPDACQQAVEVGAGELPIEGRGGGVVVVLEGEDLGGELIKVFEVVGGEELALEDGEVDLLSQDAWTGRWTICAFGWASLSRAAAAQLRCEAPLSTTQKTRLAEVYGPVCIT